MQFSNDTWWLLGLLIAGAITIISFFLKRTINQSDTNAKAISEIQRTYVTKDELKDVKMDINKSMGKLQTDVEQIRDNCLTKKDFYANQNRLEAKIDKQNELILELIKGGNKIGFEQ